VGTHVVSAIINVDQDVEQDWPLLILDHECEIHCMLCGMFFGVLVFALPCQCRLSLLTIDVCTSPHCRVR